MRMCAVYCSAHPYAPVQAPSAGKEVSDTVVYPRRFLSTSRMTFVIVGWFIFALLCWKVAGAKLDNKVYDPFEILGIGQGLSEKEIKSHFKQLSKK